MTDTFEPDADAPQQGADAVKRDAERTLEFEPRGVTPAEHDAMRRAFGLAAHGPADNENPQVGCIILDADGNYLAGGWHNGAGSPHAETAALDAAAELAKVEGGSARDGQIQNSQPLNGKTRAGVPHTAVVTLEPCAHVGRTGSCAQALIDAGIRRVIYSVPDHTPCAGGGANLLRAAGIEVLGGVHIGRGRELIAGWASRSATDPGRPRLAVKWAATLDSKSAAADGTSQWISSDAALEHSHVIRGKVDAIAVGTGTALADNPRLTARGDGPNERNPLRVVVGERDLPNDFALLTEGPSILRVRGRDASELVEALALNSVETALVDGGPTLVSSLLRAGVADEIHVYLSPKLLGAGLDAVGDLGIGTLADVSNWEFAEVERCGPDLFLRLVPLGSATTPTPSALPAASSTDSL